MRMMSKGHVELAWFVGAGYIIMCSTLHGLRYDTIGVSVA